MNGGTTIIHGPIGEGKIPRHLELADGARDKNLHVMGVASLRVMEEGETVAYEASHTLFSSLTFSNAASSL